MLCRFDRIGAKTNNGTKDDQGTGFLEYWSIYTVFTMIAKLNFLVARYSNLQTCFLFIYVLVALYSQVILTKKVPRTNDFIVWIVKKKGKYRMYLPP